MICKTCGGVRNSAVASQSCPSAHITADKRKIKDFPKLPLATSFVRKTLGEIAFKINKRRNFK
jgi:hypothetical protein